MNDKPVAARSLRNACKIFTQDLEALPAEAFCHSFGPKVRTVADIVYEVNMVNDQIGMILRGEEPFEWPEDGWVKAPSGFSEKSVVLAAFQNSSEKACSTAESFTSAELDEPITVEGKETTRAERCRFMTLHIWYHSGQLNFIQTLLGDDGWNWK